MRTTLDIDDGVLAAARALARDAGGSIGSALSDLARRGLAASPAPAAEHGFPVFGSDSSMPPITPEIVNAHRDG